MPEFTDVHERKIQRLGVLAALTTVFPGIALALFVAVRTFWSCPEGGCSLQGWPAKLRLLRDVGGLAALLVAFSLALQFAFVLIARLFCSKRTIEDVFLRHSLPLLGWHDRVMRKWIQLLWHP